MKRGIRTAAFLFMFIAGTLSVFAAGGPPEPSSASDTLLCISRSYDNNAGDDTSAVEKYTLVVRGPENREISISAGSWNNYTTGLRAGSYTATELQAYRVSDNAITHKGRINIPFTMQAGHITIFPAKLITVLNRSGDGSLTQQCELKPLSSSQTRAILDDVKGYEGFSWSWNNRSYEVAQNIRGTVLDNSTAVVQSSPTNPQGQPASSSSTAESSQPPQPPPSSGSSIPASSSIGVLDITPKQGVSEMEADIVTDFVYDALYRYSADRYMIISRQNREAILAEHEFSMSGFCDDTSCALEVGRYLSADFVIIGSFTKFGTKYYISLQLVDVNTTRVVGSAREGADDLDGIAAVAVDSCVANIF